MSQKIFFKTFGCRTNLFDTQVMREKLKNFECVDDEENADIVVVNSCTVTNGADSGVRSYVNKLHNIGKKVYFTGCGVKTQGQKLFEKNLTFGVFDHSYKEKIDDFLHYQERFFYTDRADEDHLDSTLVSEFVGKHRAFIKIQEGCDFACSYCIIPFVRGKARSMDSSKILNQISILADKGISEVVLTGTNVGSYGMDKGTNIAKLIKSISKITGIKRIRIGSLEPSQINDEFLELLDADFMEKHLHIALQYTQNSMLERMNRHNRFDNDFILLQNISKKGFAIGTDFIIGHPGEDEFVWAEAFENVKSLPLTHIHPFIYSPRENTPSASMGNIVNGNISKYRLHQLNTIVKEKNLTFRKNLKSQKKSLNVLIENFQNGFYNGLDEYFNKIKIHSKSPISSKWLVVSDYKVLSDINEAQIEE
ncbi:tRNA (N(6)-L-threonylcarbamoyladenosine(37)-C(2))-methylthiotransferase MtaB [Helicobacter cappadocius]|uniref:tRNA (N(6)-L-threonylcarbamoyladenosine(37)-C(2))-methylthiotransferase MtaB n=1 Tax=Helicobacter cappadocius TaxID=3063998 RepID=A0AA90TEG8_9HELI|nr:MULTISPECIES: tRNA (N(6)-L-threonylcarbamoyladenosine(37)-C(2))-methylthiotransferase MtaB [unclassified Helicobacter]MDO7252712.1 tRNA (N(6)-L-threonylcarbamoyladenosine(37)-C(2))-methylthiotransferase MtaB [Helicobacter sp. faydin-H75]MDP2538580.1 tRNA (N(6)-L-threonylcarbamoyladenosine(37)-C(2))-methylthiotransferase MtaB [Helicobacter sp. faydin-H76]